MKSNYDWNSAFKICLFGCHVKTEKNGLNIRQTLTKLQLSKRKFKYKILTNYSLKSQLIEITFDAKFIQIV